jgi:hypothetical protein
LNGRRVQLTQPIHSILSPFVHDFYVFALNVANLLQALAKPTKAIRHRLKGTRIEIPNNRHRRLLRVDAERPSGRTADKRDELAPPHARPRTKGIVAIQIGILKGLGDVRFTPKADIDWSLGKKNAPRNDSWGRRGVT